MQIDGTEARYRLLLDGALQIITLHKTDSGIYLCTADNQVGPAVHNRIQLDVLGIFFLYITDKISIKHGMSRI